MNALYFRHDVRQLSQRRRKHFVTDPAWVVLQTPQRVWVRPGRQAILRQIQVKKAGLVTPFHKFVVNNHFEHDSN